MPVSLTLEFILGRRTRSVLLRVILVSYNYIRYILLYILNLNRRMNIGTDFVSIHNIQRFRIIIFTEGLLSSRYFSRVRLESSFRSLYTYRVFSSLFFAFLSPSPLCGLSRRNPSERFLHGFSRSALCRDILWSPPDSSQYFYISYFFFLPFYSVWTFLELISLSHLY